MNRTMNCAMNRRRIAIIALCAAIVPQLQGCFPMVAAGAGAAALSAIDRRTTGTQVEDEGIELRASNRISERFGDKVHVNVTSFNRSVLLTGEVPDETTRVAIEKIVLGVPNVRGVTNERRGGGGVLAYVAFQRFLPDLEGEGAVRRCQQVQCGACQGGDGKQRGVPARPGDAAGGGRGGGDRAHHRRRAQGGQGVRVLPRNRRSLPAARPAQARAEKVTLVSPAFERKLLEPRTAADMGASLARPLVFTNGVFDVLHRGHVTYLAQARALGSALIVAVNSDASARRLGKGADRPVNPLEDRMALIAALESVDYVTWFDEDTPLGLILAIRPEVLVKGGDWPIANIVGAKEVAGWGGRAVSIPFEHQRSTTELLARIRR